MDNRKHFEAIVTELGKSMGIPDLALDEEDGCVIAFDEEIVVNLQYVVDNNSLILFSNLGTIDGKEGSDLFAEMLEANFYERARGGCSIGYHRETETALSIYQTPVGFLEPQEFENIVERFVNYSKAWQKRLIEGKTAAIDASAFSDQPVPPDAKA